MRSTDKGGKMTDTKPKTTTEKLANSHYQPTKAEMEWEFDMPEMAEEDIRKAFFNPTVPGRPKQDRE